MTIDSDPQYQAEIQQQEVARKLERLANSLADSSEDIPHLSIKIIETLGSSENLDEYVEWVKNRILQILRQRRVA